MSDLSRKFIVSMLFSISFIIAFFVGKLSSNDFLLAGLTMSGIYSMANLMDYFIHKK